MNKREKVPCVFCANCGCVGHIYKNCVYPITSYGIICFRLVTDKVNQSVYPEYLMVQRKDSLNYVEFVRGKYELKQRNYIMKMFQNMTEEERNELQTMSFSDIWMKLWNVTNCHHFEREYNESKRKFDILKKGYIIDRGAENGGYMHFSLDYVLENTKSSIKESEWGFPKGRRNINETDVTCALREFSEETSMKMKYIKVDQRTRLEETFVGSNKIKYKHIYYLASCPPPNIVTDKMLFTSDIRHKIFDINEIKYVKWFRYHEGQKMIREQNIDRKYLFRNVNQIVLKNIGIIYSDV